MVKLWKRAQPVRSDRRGFRLSRTTLPFDAATAYKIDTDAIAATVKQEFAAKEKEKAAKKAAPKPPVKAQTKPARKSAAA